MEVVTIFGLQIPMATIHHLEDAVVIMLVFGVGVFVGWLVHSFTIIEITGDTK